MTSELEVKITVGGGFNKDEWLAVWSQAGLEGKLEPDFIETVFNLSTGSFRVDLFDESITVAEVELALDELSRVVDPQVDKGLGQGKRHGFNWHGKSHCKAVEGRLAWLMEGMCEIGGNDYDEREQKKVKLAARLHDIGGIWGRKGHEEVSSEAGALLLAESMLNPNSVEAALEVLFAVERHRGDRLEDTRLFWKWREFEPLAVALKVADNIETAHYSRVNFEADVVDENGIRPAIEEDAHFAVNLLTVGNVLNYATPDMLTWQIQFSPYLEPGIFTRLVKVRETGVRAWVPSKWHRRFEEEGRRYFPQYIDEYLSLYAEKIFVTTAGLYHFDSNIDEVHIEFVDVDPEKGGSSRLLVTCRNTWADDLRDNNLMEKAVGDDRLTQIYHRI